MDKFFTGISGEGSVVEKDSLEDLRRDFDALVDLLRARGVI